MLPLPPTGEMAPGNKMTPTQAYDGSPTGPMRETNRTLIGPMGELTFHSHYHEAPATCLVVALRRLKRLVTAIMRIRAASPCSS